MLQNWTHTCFCILHVKDFLSAWPHMNKDMWRMLYFRRLGPLIISNVVIFICIKVCFCDYSMSDNMCLVPLLSTIPLPVLVGRHRSWSNSGAWQEIRRSGHRMAVYGCRLPANCPYMSDTDMRSVCMSFLGLSCPFSTHIFIATLEGPQWFMTRKCSTNTSSPGYASVKTGGVNPPA